ncbi:Predicted transporter (major facilitator superfamily) [Phaffia rhodozyma]|uniref:Predicted transporter (Major facilitator superfamily) n=1 Tax=Phaffia rhodozyma TaxID=264483 RepID=A0A0F7SFG1_PHARH|nr:Predicted transporter (major facilitator superfamily) [Phaffia rhodozyma]
MSAPVFPPNIINSAVDVSSALEDSESETEQPPTLADRISRRERSSHSSFTSQREQAPANSSASLRRPSSTALNSIHPLASQIAFVPTLSSNYRQPVHSVASPAADDTSSAKDLPIEPYHSVQGTQNDTTDGRSIDQATISLSFNQGIEEMSYDNPAADGKETGSLTSFRGIMILVVISASQMLDNVSMTSVNMALTAISKELQIRQADEQWLISAYTLTFGGFLLLAGVFADRWGKKYVFICGMSWLSAWTLIDGFAKTEIQLIVFRAMQGLGAAATVPSAVGIISSYFVGRERNTALTIFGAAGAVGFTLGLIFGGVLTDALGWRWIFWLTAPIGAVVSVIAYLFLPDTKNTIDGPKPALDFIGAGVATSGLILLTFVLSSGGVYGWGKGFIVGLLIVALACLFGFAFVEQKVQNPILPNHLTMQNIRPNSHQLEGWWQSIVLYLTLLSQNVLHMSPLDVSVRFIPMGVAGALASYTISVSINYVKIKTLMLIGLTICFVSVLPAALVKPDTSFWQGVFPSSMLGVVGISLVYNVVSVSMMSSVPPSAKSLAGGLINTAFQIGAGFGLAICAAVVTATTKSDPDATTTLLTGYKDAIWTTAAFVGVSLLLAIGFIKNEMIEIQGPTH